MDKNISYNDAVGAVEASVLSFDTSKLRSTLRRFPVLQVFAAQRLMHKLVALKNADAPRAVISITEMICCITSPRDSFTAECRMCATIIFYSIRDRNESMLRAILKRMIFAKRSCDGCGLFVYVVSSESLKQCGALTSFIADHLNEDEIGQYDACTHFWTQALELFERETLLKSDDRSPVADLQKVSVRNAEARNLRRLSLRTDVCRKWRKRRRRNAKISSDIRKCFDGTHNERLTLLKLATMHAVCPDLVAEKLNAYGLKSYCATTVHALCDSVSSSERKGLTNEDVLGLKSVANMMSDPRHVQTLSVCRNGLSKELVLSRGKGHDLFSLYNPWMPLEVGTQNTIKHVLSGELPMDTILDNWAAAKGNMCPSVDQTVVAVLSDEEAFQNLTTNHLCLQGTTGSSDDAGSVINTRRGSPFRQVNEYLRCLEQALLRGVGYPSAFWDQTEQVFQSFTDVAVWALLLGIQGVCKEQVKEAVMRIRSVEKQLQDHLDYRRIEPRKDCAVLKMCDCSSVEMVWKHVGRLRFTAWRNCRCMFSSTVFVRVPKPSLWFSWVRGMHNAKNDSTSNIEVSNSSVSASLWLYGNPALRGVQYNNSESEVFRCVIDNALQDETGAFLYDIEDVLAHVLRNREACQNIMSEIVTNARKMTRNAKHVPEQRNIDGRLRLLRKSIERLWTSACQKSNLSKSRRESAMGTRTPSTDAQNIERLLTIVAPCPSALHDCIRDMPTLCEHITLIHRHLLSNDKIFGDTSMHVKIIAGLLSPSIARKRLLSSKTDRFPHRDSIFESVMRCFE